MVGKDFLRKNLTKCVWTLPPLFGHHRFNIMQYAFLAVVTALIMTLTESETDNFEMPKFVKLLKTLFQIRGNMGEEIGLRIVIIKKIPNTNLLLQDCKII